MVSELIVNINTYYIYFIRHILKLNIINQNRKVQFLNNILLHFIVTLIILYNLIYSFNA